MREVVDLLDHWVYYGFFGWLATSALYVVGHVALDYWKEKKEERRKEND